MAVSIKALSESELTAMRRFLDRYYRKSFMVKPGSTFDKSFGSLIAYWGNQSFSKEAVRHKEDILRMIDGLIDVARGEFSDIDRIRKLQEREMRILEKLPRFRERLKEERNEAVIYKNLWRLLQDMPKLLEELKKLVSDISERDLDLTRIQDTRRRFEEMLGQEGTLVDNIVHFEERMSKEAA